jgi:hypothetical protein
MKRCSSQSRPRSLPSGQIHRRSPGPSSFVTTLQWSCPRIRQLPCTHLSEMGLTSKPLSRSPCRKPDAVWVATKVELSLDTPNMVAVSWVLPSVSRISVTSPPVIVAFNKGPQMVPLVIVRAAMHVNRCMREPGPCPRNSTYAQFWPWSRLVEEHWGRN